MPFSKTTERLQKAIGAYAEVHPQFADHLNDIAFALNPLDADEAPRHAQYASGLVEDFLDSVSHWQDPNLFPFFELVSEALQAVAKQDEEAQMQALHKAAIRIAPPVFLTFDENDQDLRRVNIKEITQALHGFLRKSLAAPLIEEDLDYVEGLLRDLRDLDKPMYDGYSRIWKDNYPSIKRSLGHYEAACWVYYLFEKAGKLVDNNWDEQKLNNFSQEILTPLSLLVEREDRLTEKDFTWLWAVADHLLKGPWFVNGKQRKSFAWFLDQLNGTRVAALPWSQTTLGGLEQIEGIGRPPTRHRWPHPTPVQQAEEARASLETSDLRLHFMGIEEFEMGQFVSLRQLAAHAANIVHTLMSQIAFDASTGFTLGDLEHTITCLDLLSRGQRIPESLAKRSDDMLSFLRKALIHPQSQLPSDYDWYQVDRLILGPLSQHWNTLCPQFPVVRLHEEPVLETELQDEEEPVLKTMNSIHLFETPAALIGLAAGFNPLLIQSGIVFVM